MGADCTPRAFPAAALPAERLALLSREVDDAARSALVGEWALACAVEADRVTREARALGAVYLHPWAYVDAVMGSLQGLYVHEGPGESAGRDTYRGVAATLRCGGDCGPLSAACVALVRRYPGEPGVVYAVAPLAARLVWVRQPTRPVDHVSALVTMGARGSDAPVILDAGADAPEGWQWADVSMRAARGEAPWSASARLRATEGA